MELLYKPDWPLAKKRIEAFWHGESIGRPLVSITAPNGKKPSPPPPKKTLREKIFDFEYRVLFEEDSLRTTYFGGEAVPCVWPDFSPDFTAACLGGDLDIADRPADSPFMGSVWSRHVLSDWEKMKDIGFNPENPWFKRGVEFTRLAMEMGKGKFLVESLDVDGGMDTCAGLRGAQQLCLDILDSPEEVQKLLDIVREGNRQVVNSLIDLVRDYQGGMVNTYRIYAPGKSYNMRSDFSFLINPQLFRSFVLPYIIKESMHDDFIIFHTHSEDAERNSSQRLAYLDVILSVPRLHAVEWHCQNLPVSVLMKGIRKILDAGKRVVTYGSPERIMEILSGLKKDEAEKIWFQSHAESKEEADALIKNLETKKY